MSQHDDFDRLLARWFDAEARPAATADVLDRALLATRRRRPRPGLFAALGSHWVGGGHLPNSGVAALGRTGLRTSMALLLLLLLVLVLAAGAVLIGARLRQPAPVGLGIFEPISGWTVHGNDDGIWGDNPDGPDVKLKAGAGIPLGWSRDGTRLLLGRQGLVVLDADGSETRLTTTRLTDSFVRTATISPDGSRVVFATIDGPGNTGSLFSVDAEGGSAEVLLELDGLEGVSFSPDGTQIAYVSGHGDGDHRVSVMDADGTSVREILANEVTLGAGHDHGIAWSPAGDRIALGIEGVIYTFAPDGSGFTAARFDVGRLQPFWSPDGSQLEKRGPRHPGKFATTASPSVVPTPVPSLELDGRTIELLNDFVQARVDGLGAGNFVRGPREDVPLLYATSAGASYERGEFERVLGVEWPYGWMGFKVRLHAGGTVVEQLFFTSPSSLGLEYQADGFRTDIAPTTEDGQPVGVPATYFDGEVTMQNIHPWVSNKLIPEGAKPTTDGGERNDWKPLVVKADPATCHQGRPADAEGLAEGIRSDPDLQATPPVAVSAGGANALVMDVVTTSGVTACLGFSLPIGDRMRLFLIDAPEGASMRVLGIAIDVPESSFARAVAPAASMVDSIEFHTP